MTTCITEIHHVIENDIAGSEVDDLILTFHRGYYGGALHGILRSHNNAFFSIEFVEYNLHAFKTLKSFGSNSRQLSFGEQRHSATVGNKVRSSSDHASIDSTSIVTVYIKFYYTQMFYESTDDVNSFIDRLLSQLNKDLKVMNK